MPAVKFTMLMQHVSNVAGFPGTPTRIGGFSETWYKPGTDLAAARTLARDGGGANQPSILTARAALLPRGSSIIGQRYQIVDPRGPAQSDARFYAAAFTNDPDIPQVGLLTKIPAVGLGNIRTQIIRALPDSMVIQGEFNPTPPYLQSLTSYRDAIGAWNFRGRDLTQTAFVIISISSVGVVSTQLPHGYVINDRIRILKTLTAAGNTVGGLFYVTAVPSSTSFTLNVWTHGSAVGGSARKEVIIYPAVSIGGVTFGRTVTKRVGRPFVGYRGRRRASRS